MLKYAELSSRNKAPSLRNWTFYQYLLRYRTYTGFLIGIYKFDAFEHVKTNIAELNFFTAVS